MILTYIITSSLFSYGMFTIQRPGFLLDFLPKLWGKLPKGLHEPLYQCGICASSIWGATSFVYLLLVDKYHMNEMFWIPVVLVCAAGITAFIDRSIKAFEKHYGYKPPSTQPADEKWNYLLPYEEMRTMMIEQTVVNAYANKHTVIEIGGTHYRWQDKFNGNYHSFSNTKFTRKNLDSYRPYKFSVVILGLAWEGDLRVLKDLIKYAHTAIIEYSDDGISRQQINLITEGLNVKLLIPEYEINVVKEVAPKECGTSVAKRKVLIIQNK